MFLTMLIQFERIKCLELAAACDGETEIVENV